MRKRDMTNKVAHDGLRDKDDRTDRFGIIIDELHKRKPVFDPSKTPLEVYEKRLSSDD